MEGSHTCARCVRGNNINQGLAAISGVVNQAIVEKAIMALHD